MKSLFASTLVAATLIATSAAAAAAEPRTPTPQMMRGQWGGGYGPGMMGGGYGPGMMGGGYGPGMMGGGYGPGQGGMMGGGYGPGQGGMMGGGMGPGYGMGMMGGWGVGMGPLYMLDLTDAQAAQMEKIQTEMMSKHRALARQMWEEQEKLGDMYSSDKRDPAKIGKAYSNIADLQRQMIEMHTEAENKMEALLTKEQKAQLRRNYGRGMMGY